MIGDTGLPRVLDRLIHVGAGSRHFKLGGRAGPAGDSKFDSDSECHWQCRCESSQTALSPTCFRLTRPPSALQVLLLAVASVTLGCLYGLIFGVSEVGKGVFTMHTLRVRNTTTTSAGRHCCCVPNMCATSAPLQAGDA